MCANLAWLLLGLLPQDKIHEWTTDGGDPGGDCFGYSVSGGTDFNSDGVPDLVIGAILRRPPKVWVKSGKDGASLLEVEGEQSGSHFGWEALPLGDVTGDQVPELLIAAPAWDTAYVDNFGRTYVCSGFDGTFVYTFTGLQRNSELGHSIAVLGDLDADGCEDFAVAAPFHNVGTEEDAGIAYIYSGKQGVVIDAIRGKAIGDVLGWDMDSAGDIDHDGTLDLAVGIPEEDGVRNGRVVIHSGSSRKKLREYFG